MSSVNPVTGSDSTVNAIKIALEGLSKRQEIIGQNIANNDTPGYQAQNVSFESAVKQALEKNETGSLAMTSTNASHLTSADARAAVFQTGYRSGGSERVDGNNVDMDVELVQQTETGYRYQALTQLVSKKFSLLKTIAGAK
jgi:flagellar basal-body rod protein FlgB